MRLLAAFSLLAVAFAAVAADNALDDDRGGWALLYIFLGFVNGLCAVRFISRSQGCS